MSVDDLLTPVNAEFSQMEQALQALRCSEVELVNQVCNYLINRGGKRLRPLILLLIAKTAKQENSAQVALAVAVELIHSATLLHDDVVDESDKRRGQLSAHQRWSNATSVLVGDFLYSRAFQLMVEAGNANILKVFADATNTIAEGEVQQLMQRRNLALQEADYLHVLRCKTGKLFEVAAHIGAVLAELSEEATIAMQNYGMHLGTAFQLIDDVLDYESSTEELGKNIGDDLADGNPTLPLLYALSHSPEQEKAMLSEALLSGHCEDLSAIQQTVRDCGALTYSKQLALNEADQAITCLHHLPASDSKIALTKLAEFAINRSY